MKDYLSNFMDEIEKAGRITVFSGAGVSVESGIPPFRGKEGLWSKYDPVFLDLSYFQNRPLDSWKMIKKIFYDFMGDAQPNGCHRMFAELENKGLVTEVITQNIDNLHQKAGSKNVIEYHGNTRNLVCLKCGKITKIKKDCLNHLPPRCEKCGAPLKPDFIFFGEGIPHQALVASEEAVKKSDLFIVAGTSGNIYPASYVPIQAKKNGARIVEINIEPSNYTDSITDLFIQKKAGDFGNEVMKLIR